MYSNVLISNKNYVLVRRTYCFSAEFSAIDVIFPVNLFGEKFVEDEKCAELYKISHHAYGTGEQLKRKFVLKKRDFFFNKPNEEIFKNAEKLIIN